MPKRTPEKKKKSNFIFSDFGILLDLVCCLGRVHLHKNPRNICVAICFGFTKKSLVCLDYQKTSAEIQRFLPFIKGRNLLLREHISFLTPKNPRTPIFYMLPKIHNPNNPGRPIVLACDGPTENLSLYIDSFIKPLAQQVKSYIKESNQFLQKLTELGQVPPNSYPGIHLKFCSFITWHAYHQPNLQRYQVYLVIF